MALAAVFEDRERVLVARLAWKLFGKRGPALFAVWNAEASLVQAVARAHAERVTVGACVAKVRQFKREQQDSETAKALESLVCLWALKRIEAGAASFLSSGAISASDLAVATAGVDAHARELVPAARALVDAFGLPDSVITAPIAQDDYCERLRT